MKNIKDLYNRYKGGLFISEHKNFDKIKSWTGKVELNYCNQEEVLRKKMIFLKFKA